MSKIEWKEKYSIGHEQIDKQHQYLLELLNAIDENTDYDSKSLQDLFLKLRNYTDIHFSDEEALMKKVGYPEIEQHKLEHVFFVKKIKETQEKIATGIEVDIREISLLLSDWLVNHILIRDMELKVYVEKESGEYIHLDI